MLGEQHTFCGKPVQIGRTEFLLSQAAQVTIAQIVGDEIDDVGKGLLRNLLLATQQTGKYDHG
jgi:hypothetical protein